MLGKALDKINDRIFEVPEQTVINALETRNVNNNIAFVKAAPGSAMSALPLSITDDSYGVRQSFERVIVKVANVLIRQPRLQKPSPRMPLR